VPDRSDRTDLHAAFAAAMDRLAPWEPAPRLAVGASGGADSSALTLLAQAWVRPRGGSVLALIVDHRLRPESTAEAALTRDRLAARGIAARILTLTDLRHGPALAERARRARYHALTAACAQAGILHLLLGHHAGDQAETVMIRALGGSATRGLAAMPALAETTGLRVLRPLLEQPPVALRHLLMAERMPWVEDPSNADRRALRGRLRALRAEPDGADEGTRSLVAAAVQAGRLRAVTDLRVAQVLAERVAIRPEGFARLSPGAIDPGAMSAVLQAIAGAAYPPPPSVAAALARDPRPGTVAGVRLLPAGRWGPGLLAVREQAAIARPAPAEAGMIWDNRFRLIGADLPPGLTIAALGDAAPRVRRGSALPSAVLRTLPALYRGNLLVAVPHLLYRDAAVCPDVRLVWQPPHPMGGAPFLPAGGVSNAL
jgi:tRNA(Ile)-lysidine synthase